MILQPETIKLGMSTYLITLKRAWRAVDALGGTSRDPEINQERRRALDHACDAIELLISQQTIRELDAGMWSAD